jgi:hypothetical protein
MINDVVVMIIANRILTKGLNPKTGEIYILSDITNAAYKLAVENYILEHTTGV